MPSELPDPCPPITGSACNVVRVAVVQLAYHPALRGSLADPFGKSHPKGVLPLSMLPHDASELAVPQGPYGELSDRIQATYTEQLDLKLRAILSACRAWGVRLVVLPEYSVPAASLEAVADESVGMVVVAGAGFVDRRVQKSQVFEQLGASQPGLRQNVAAVLHDRKVIRTVAKLNPTPPEAELDLVRGSTWEPVTLPEESGGPMGVLICLDFLERQYEAYTKLVEPKLDQCRFLAVPALTPSSSLPLFLGHLAEEAGPRRRPVLFANHAPGGGSTLVVNERSLEELKDFPSHAGVFASNEEGVLVADIDLTIAGVGKGGRFGECLPIKPFAAASLIHPGITKALGAWHASLRDVLRDVVGDRDEGEVLDRVVAWLRENPLPREDATPMQKRRWNRLRLSLDRESSLEEVRRLTREVVLPPDVLPLPELEEALARGASRVMHGWVQGAIEGAAPFATVATLLEDRARKGESKRATWVDASRQAWAAIVEKVRGEPAAVGSAVLSPLDRATDTIENQVVKAAIDKGNGLAGDGRYEEAREQYLLAREEALRQGTPNPQHGEKWRLWAARGAIGAAACAINLQDPDGARTLVKEIPLDVLDAERRLRVANLWAATGDAEKARAAIPNSSEVSEELRQDYRDVLQRIGLVEGRVPQLDELSSSPDIRILAANVLAARHKNAALAASVAAEVLDQEDLFPAFRVQAVLPLLEALFLTVHDLAPDGGVPTDSRAELVAAIERNVPPLMRADLPQPLARSLRQQWWRFLHTAGDVDGLRLTPGPDDWASDEVETPMAAAVDTARRLLEHGHVEAALASLPDDDHLWRTRLTRVELLQAADQSDRALAEALALAEDLPDRAPIELMASQLLSKQGRHEEALDHAQRGLAALPARGLRLRVAQCLLSLNRDQEAWEVIAGDEATAGPRLLRALAIAADTVHLERALDLWQQYVEQVPHDDQARVHVARHLAAQHRGREAAEMAWEVFEERGEHLSIDLLHTLGGLQMGIEAKAERKRRRDAVAQTLKRRFPSDPLAEQARLALLVSEGKLEASSPPIDFGLLQGAGVVQAMTTREVIDVIRGQRELSQHVAHLGRQGSLPIGHFCANTRPPIPMPLLVTQVLGREQTDLPFATPVQVADRPDGFFVKGSNLLASEVELYFVAALGLLDELRDRLDTGKVHVFRSSWLRVVDDQSLLRPLATDRSSETLGQEVAALSRLPRVRPEAGEVISDVQKALALGGAVLASKDAELRKAGVDVDQIPEARRISPSAVLRRLREEGRISAAVLEAIQKYYPDDADLAVADPVPSPLLVRVFFLELLWNHGVLEEFLSVFPTVHVGEDDWRALLEKQRDTLATEEAFRLADRLHAWIADGMHNGWLQILPDPHVGGLPIPHDPEDETVRRLVMEPLEWAAKYADCLAANRNWWRLTADLLGSTVPVTMDALRFTRWEDPQREAPEFLRRLRSGTDRHVTLPALVRLLLSDPSDVESRNKTLWKLAQLGFADALGATELLALSKEYGGLGGSFPTRVLDRMEWMAREPAHAGGEMARLRLTTAYAAAIFTAFCGVPKGDRETEPSLDEPAGLLPRADAEAFGRGLLGRAESLSIASRTDVLERVIAFIGAHTTSDARLAWKRTEDATAWTQRPDSPLSVLWEFLYAWAGVDGARRAALNRGVREVWLAVDGRDETTRIVMSAALAHVFTGHSGTGMLRLTDLGFEAAAILSAEWQTRPLLARGIKLVDRSEGAAFEEILKAGAQGGEPLELDPSGRSVLFTYAPGSNASLRIVAPAEAVLLRQSPEDAQALAAKLKRRQGPHDGRMYRLLAGLERHSARSSVRRAVARRAVLSLWRAVRDDPAHLARWPKSRRLLVGGTQSSLAELRAILSEPSVMEPPGDHLGTVLFHRQEGIWREREDSWDLVQMAMEVPGPLAVGPVWTLLEREYEAHVDEALSILDDIEDQPIARVARSIFLLRAGAAKNPVVKLPSGESVDLRECLPARLGRVLEHVVDIPRPDTFADAEPLLMRVCAQVIGDLAGPQPLTIREGLWLTYRLFQWLCAQLDAVPPKERSAGINALCALAPPPHLVRDRLDPYGFGRDLFDHRLAAVLHALGAMEEISHGLVPKPLRLAWEPAMTDMLLELASRPEESLGLGSELAWDAPDNVADLALVALLRVEPKLFDRLPSEARLRRFQRLPADPNTMRRADRLLYFALMAGVASNPETCSDDERKVLVERLRSSPRGPVTSYLRMMVFPGLFSTQQDVSEQEALTAVLDALDEPLAPMALSYLLFGVAQSDVDRMPGVLNQVILEAERRQIDPVPLAAGVGRVFLLVDGPARESVIDLVRELAERPPFKNDERMRELMTAFGGD